MEEEEQPKENISELIKKAAEERLLRIQNEATKLQMKQQKQIQDIIDRKIRDKNREIEKEKKIKTIEDVLKKGQKIKWEIINNNLFKGFVKNKNVFEIKRGLTIFNLYIKDNSLLIENTKKGYLSCSSSFENLKKKAESLIKQD